MSSRFSETEATRDTREDELHALRVRASQVRQLLGSEAWEQIVAPFMNTYREEAVARVMATPESGPAEIYLKGCVEGQQALLGVLDQVLQAEARALGELSIADDEDEDNPTASRRFG